MTLVTFTRGIVPTHKEENSIKIKFDTITQPYKGKNYTIPT